MSSPDPTSADVTFPRLNSLTDELDTPDSEKEWDLRARLRDAHPRIGGLGRLEELAIWFAGVQHCSPPQEPRRVRLVIFAGDHGIRAAQVSASTESNSAREVRQLRAGSGITNRLAELTDVGVRVVDVSVDSDVDSDVDSEIDETGTGREDGGPGQRDKVRLGSGRIDVEDALSAEEAARAVGVGARIADEEIDRGADVLVIGDLGIASTTVAATLISVITGTEPARVVGRGGGIDDATWMRKVTAIRDARRRAMTHRHDLDQLLATIGGADLAAMTGFLLRAATRRTPVLLDGVVTCAAALLAREVDPRAPRWWQAALVTQEPAQAVALERLRLEPLTTSGVDLGRGAGALLAVPMLRAAVRAVRELVPEEEPDRDGLVPDVTLDKGRPDESSG